MSNYLDLKEKYPPYWPFIAYLIKSRAGWRCEHCGHPDDFQSGHVLTVHHLDMNPLNCDHTNLVALCQRCHLSIQSRYHPSQVWLGSLKPQWLEERGL